MRGKICTGSRLRVVMMLNLGEEVEGGVRVSINGTTEGAVTQMQGAEPPDAEEKLAEDMMDIRH